MGIYDRDYNRAPYGDSDRMGFTIGGSLSLTTKLVLVMFGVYVVQLLTRPADFRSGNLGWFSELFSMHGDVLRRPWQLFELITYGFLHDPGDLKHIIFNCLAFWMFGRSVEQRYGEKEYLVYFLSAVVFSALVWLLGELALNGKLLPITLLGASGGIAAVLLLFCLNFPHQMVYIWGIVPIPAWVFAIVFVGQDMIFAMQRNDDDRVAYSAHLGGALFAAVYFKSGIRLARWLPSGVRLPRLSARPNLRVHAPDDADEDTDTSSVDDILRKITETGQDSLTRRERQILEEASRREQQKRTGR
jgi:membrane associated rhomboid family serine protease